MKKLLTLICLALVFALVSSRIYHYARSHWIIPDVTVAGFIQMADGLGRQSVELIDVLKERFDVHFQKTRPEHHLEDVPKALFKILQERKRPLGKVVIFEDTLGQPLEYFEKVFHKMRPHQLRIAYSMFETSKIPPSFVYKLHHYFDAVVVADPYNIESYKHSGVNLPIFTLPLGLDLDLFIKAPIKSHKQTPFVFGSFGSCEARKNFLTTIRAFALAFGQREDVILKIHSRRGTPSAIAAVEQEIERLGLSNVIFSVGSLDKAHYLENFQSIDCYVSLSKGEGFSIQPREALALGIPTIVSDQTAQSTICHSGYVKSVPATLLEKAYYEALPDEDYGDQFNVSIEDAASAFLEVFNNYETYLSLAHQGREWVKQYEYHRLKGFYLNLIKPKKLLLGDENLLTEDLLITDNRALYEKYLKIYPHLNLSTTLP